MGFSNKRYLGALIISPFIIFLFLGGIYLKCLTFVLSFMGMYEFYKVTKVKDLNPMKYLGYLALIGFFVLNNDITKLAYVLIPLVFLCLCVPIIDVERNYFEVAVTVLGFIYVGVFFSFISTVNAMQYGSYLVWLIFIASWGCDTLAYYSGRFLGKTKLCPKVSAKKTVEGSIGGLIGAAIGCGIFGYIIKGYGVNIELYHFFIMGAICGVFSQFGDLVASSIKRYKVDIKDYSNLIPGHGGILDRFDSILYSGVIVFFYLKLVVGL